MRIVLAVTDAGKAFIKPLGGSDHGPHCLACEWIGTRLAQWYGLPTLQHALMTLTTVDAEMIRQAGGRAEPGSAFVTRAIGEANPWSGTAEELEKAVNQEMIPRLVAFDTWTLNWDRCPPQGDSRRPNYDNVLLARDERGAGRVRILAIDHGECFAVAQELTPRIASMNRVRENRLFGLFPGFRPYMRQEWAVQAAARLAAVDRQMVEGLVAGIPSEWQVADEGRNALIDLICNRASYLVDNFEDMMRFSGKELF